MSQIARNFSATFCATSATRLAQLLDLLSATFWGRQYVNEGMNSYQSNQTTFYFGRRWKGYINVDNRRTLRDVDPSAWMPFLLPLRTLLRHYMPRPLPSHWIRRLSTRPKNERLFFVVVKSKPNWSWIAVKSQLNRNFDNYIAVESQPNRSRISIVIAALLLYWQTINCVKEMTKWP